MIVLQAAGLEKYLGGHQVLKNVNFSISKGEKVGLVGVNGSGKSTFLKCLTGTLLSDAGQVFCSPDISIGYLEQLSIEENDCNAWDFVMDTFRDVLQMRERLAGLEEKMKTAGIELEKIMRQYARLQEEYEKTEGYSCENTARRILVGLGFPTDQLAKPVSSFSGGQKTRLKLARLLAARPECLLLDEPTNHLDMDSVEWLEQYLADFGGTLLLVSHDRMLLDKVPTRIVEMKNGSLYSYSGNYSSYLKQKAEQDLAWDKAFRRQQEYIKKTQDFIQRYKAGVKAKQARGRESQLKRLEVMEKPLVPKTRPGWILPDVPRSGEQVLETEDLAKSFGDNHLFSRVSFKIRRGDRLALVGPNGCGKSTLLRILQSIETADYGSVHWGSRIRVGYFAQENEDLLSSNTLLDEIYHNFDVSIEQARNYLGSILFTGDDVYKKVGDLSGGEKGRLSLLKVLLKRPNFLILDEPTNHLDIYGRQAAEDLLSSFPGSLLIVSHDRYFIDQVCEHLLVFEDKGLTLYWGDYSYYRDKRRQMAEDQDVQGDAKVERRRESHSTGIKKPSAYTLRFKLERLEGQIQLWEADKRHLEAAFADSQYLADGERTREGWKTYGELESKLEDAYMEWEKLITQLEESDQHGR